MLQVQSLSASYGPVQAVRSVSLTVSPGEIVALLGRNGAGRSTLARALLGLVPAGGSVRWQGQELSDLPAHQRARLGMAYVPESRDPFPTLSVHQNLLLGLKPGMSEAELDAAYELFPALRQRQQARAGVLSGGEQQMLSLARALMGRPSLLIVDEPTEGLAPQLVEVVAQALRRLREQGVGVLLIEQKLQLDHLADRVLLMGRGELVFEGPASRWRAEQAQHREWLEL